MSGLSQLVSRAKETLEPIPAATKRLVPLRETTHDELSSLVEKREALLPVETFAKTQLDHQIRCASVALQFPHARLLDKEVLKWRWPGRPLRAALFQIPIPKLALVNIANPVFYLRRKENNVQETSTLPSGLADESYGDILSRLNRATIFGNRYTLSFTWQGIIPESAKEIIEHGTRFFGSYKDAYNRGGAPPAMYLLTEAPFKNWTMESEPIPRPPRHVDPLIVGHMGNDLFVIGAFNPTPLEQYVAMEFLTLPPGSRGELPVSTS